MSKNNDAKKVVDIKIEGKKWQDALDKAFNEKIKDVSVDGFRKGKCPKDIYLKKYGIESLFMDAANKLVDDAYKEAIENNKEIVPIIQPSVSIKDINEDSISYTFTFITKPNVKIKKYKGLKVKKETVKVTKEEIKNEIDKLLKEYTELEIKENGKVELNNIAIIDFEGFKDGVAFEGGKGENYSLEIGSNTFIPGFEDAIIGMKKGETKNIPLTFPKDYSAKDLAGKDVEFKVTVKEIKEKIERKLDKDFFLDLNMEGVTSKETLEEAIKDQIKASKEVNANNKLEDDLLKEIAANTECDIPEELLDEEVHAMIHQFEDQLRMQGLTLDMYYKFTNMKHEDLHKQMEPEARNHILYRFILEDVMKQEKISVSDKEIDEEINSMEKKYGMKKEEILKQLGSTDMIRYDLEMRKTIDFLKEANK